MRACSLVILLIGLLLAGGTVHYANQQLDRRQPVQVGATGLTLPNTTVVVAGRDLAPGELLRAEALQEVAWPAETVPAGAFTSIQELIGDGSEERRARHAILPGEPVLRSKISGLGGRDTPGEIVSPGKRAASIRANDVNGVTSALPPDSSKKTLIAMPMLSSRTP
jgi:pilus assembly protein CpaB